MTESNADYEEALLQTVNEIWCNYDKDGNGYLDKKEMRTFINDTLGQANAKTGQSKEVSEEEFEAIFREFDIDESSTIEKDEMAILVKRMAAM